MTEDSKSSKGGGAVSRAARAARARFAKVRPEGRRLALKRPILRWQKMRRPTVRKPALQRSALLRPETRLPEPVEAAWFALQERVVWPLQDRFALIGPGPSNRSVLAGGACALVLVGVLAALLLSTGSGSSSSTTTLTEAAAPSEPVVTTPTTQPSPQKDPAPHETLHGAAPVFSPPSPASKGGEKTGSSESRSRATETEPSTASTEASAGTSSSAAPTTTSSSPASATISSDPASSKTASSESPTATAARATVLDGPPAGPAALKVAREFAQAFVVYETGGEPAGFTEAFKASATPELAKALLQRPPKQPAGVKVPRAKVLNVVAGPSRGTVYKVSVSLLRVGVTSELRLDLERIKTTGKSGKDAEWRVTNVLG